MKGDFSRIRFNPSKQYTSVLEQQGRVSLDADANEQCAINNHLRRTETIDVVGEFGGPIGDEGFAITIDQNQILIGPGRYYVEGLMCENPSSIAYGSQPFLINPDESDADLLSLLANYQGRAAIQVYLEVWQRLVTALDDPCLREPALGQADTTARLQTVWRVVAEVILPSIGTKTEKTGLVKEDAHATAAAATRSATSKAFAPFPRPPIIVKPIPRPRPIPKPPQPPVVVGTLDCCTEMYSNTLPLSTGTMSAATSGGTADCSCQPISSAGYQGIENQLYRIEIQQGGTEATATFKWSRENGSVVAAIQNVSGATITVDSLGPDANLGFQVNTWVEILDDSYLFGMTPNQPGALYQIQSIDSANLSMTMTTPVLLVDKNRNARVRRWDQSGASAGAAGVSLSAGNWLPLENGIQVNFSAGSYQSGDYWTIPARTASGQIDWPPCGGNGNPFQSPQSIAVYMAPLACIHWIPEKESARIDDCRRSFSPLTALTAPAATQALHVTAINWTNDAVVTADQWVANGLKVVLDGAPVSPMTGGNFQVTLESVFNPFNAFVSAKTGEFERAFVSEILPTTILRTELIIDSSIAVNGATIAWSMPYNNANNLQKATVNAIDAALLFGMLLGQYGRVRIKLLGNAIYSSSGNSQLYLDGESMGQNATNADGTVRVDLQLPSGNGDKSSNFESWFYVAPTVLITGLTVLYPALFALVDSNNNVTGVQASPSGPTVSPYATVTVNYPALVDTQVTLTLSDATATIQSPITIHAGERSANAYITVVSNPPNDSTITETISCAIATALGPISGPTATFTITGTTPSPG